MALSSAPPLAITGFVTIGIGLIILIWGFLLARNKDFKNHRRFMKYASLLLAAFLVQYIIRAGIMREETHFTGPNWVRTYVYIPILVVHISLALLTIYFLIKHVREALKEEKQLETGIPYFENKEYREKHRKLGQRVFYAWLFSYLGGILVFILLYLV